jgi:site-specific DNA-methyltransferase (adenine-specific)/adenine-specific DNA-methyltransferase
MAHLNWIGKEAVVHHHLDVAFHLLKADPKQSHGDGESGNLLLEGDNLIALKALLPHYAGQVKLIYIDPPYNTGNEKWVYNDNVNSPEIRAWLGEVVGREAEDLTRHEKWLCMMYPRIRLLRDFLRPDGAIFVSIDDNEVAALKTMMDEIFGPRNFVSIITWQKRVSPANDALYFSSDHEYILVYALNKDVWRPRRLPRTEKNLRSYTNPDNDPRGQWNSATYTCNKTSQERPNLYYPITHPKKGTEIWPKKTAVWRFDKERHIRNVEDRLVWWGKTGTAKKPRYKKFLAKMKQEVVPRSILFYDDCGSTQEARTEVLQILGDNPFTTPKPVRLLKRIITIATEPGDLVLDSFFGSGTTGHAVLALNREDGGRRRFIGIEMVPEISAKVTAVRLQRAISGYAYQNNADRSVAVAGVGGGFQYCHIGPEMFDENGRITEHVGFDDLARHVFFIETGAAVPKARVRSPLVCVHGGTGYYLLFNGVLGDRRPEGGNVLTGSVLEALPRHEGPKVIYGESCRLSSSRLQRENILFKQIPYQIRTR